MSLAEELLAEKGIRLGAKTSMNVKTAVEALRVHDTLIEKKKNGVEVYRCIDSKQANEIADLIVQLAAGINGIAKVAISPYVKSSIPLDHAIEMARRIVEGR